MRVLRMRLENFRGVEGAEISFAESGVTLVHGRNEVGKTSVVDALDLLLDQYDSSSKRSVKATQPVGRDVPTVVEADIRAGEHLFTYRKQFHRQTSTRLVVHEPAALQLGGREAHEEVLRVLGEQVDLPLWRALRLQQGVPLAQAELDARRSLAQALDAGVAASVGGEREETLVQRAQEEFERYWTPTGAARKERQGLDDAVREADGRAAGLAARLADLERTVERLDRARTEARDERAEAEEDAAAVRSAQARLEELRQVVRDAEAAEVAVTTAEGALALADEVCTGRQRLVARAEELAADVVGREVAVTAARAEVDEAQARARRAAEDLAGADEALASRREEEHAARRAEEVLREAVEVVRLREVLARHAAAAEEVAAAEAASVGLTVDEEALAEVEAAHRAHAGAAARAAAAAPVVVLSGAGRVLTADGEQVVGDAPLELRLAGAAWFEVGGVRVAAQPSADQERAEAEETRTEAALRAVCARLGVEGLEDAVAAASARRRAGTVLERAHEQLRTAGAGEDLDAARRRVQRWDEAAEAPATAGQGPAPAGAVPAQDLDDGVVRRTAAAEALARAVEERVRAAAREESAGTGLDEARRRLAEADQGAEVVRVRAAAAQADVAQARREASDGTLAERLAAVQQALVEAGGALALARAKVMGAGVEDVEADLTLARERADRGRKRLRGLEDTVAALAAVLDAQGGSGLVEELAEARAEHERARRALATWDRRATAARTLHEALQTARAAAHTAYVAPFRAELQRLAAPVFGAEVQVEISPDLRITSRTLDGVTVPFEQLSTGAREQLALLGRLACAVLVSGGTGVPVLVDDALGSSDPRRVEGMARALTQAGRSCQVVVLTCEPRRYRDVAVARTQRLDG
ncbi:AAA family ATPase [Pseudokineococcus sp. 1T1Z-3]|uniref:AAA family ATPase n=1 Tax=Pseudokineococcus sp. 1T1Z-3 TaxID=3132745 RepID=UPI0030A3F548